MSERVELYVLDTSAWLTLIEDESGSDVVQGILEKAKMGDLHGQHIECICADVA